MQKYKAGARQNPMMTPIMQALSDRDIEVLAEYYATLGDKSATAPDAPGADSSAVVQLTAKCVGCHGAEGQGVGAFPALAGKDAAYLIDQMNNYRSGTRQNPMMTPMAKGLTDEQIEVLAKYYATLGAKSVLAPPSTPAIPSANAKCVGCHGGEGGR